MERCSIVIPTMWRGKYIEEMVNELRKCNAVKEIIIIDNTNEPMSADHWTFIDEKVRSVHVENLYVNPSWNLGVEMATCNKIMILEDDVRFDVEHLPSMLDALDERGTVLGVAPDAWNRELTELKFTQLQYRPHSWACMMVVRKDDWVPIPNELKIWYGDDWIAGHAKKIAAVQGINIETDNETTSSSVEFDTIRRNDILHWYEKIHNQPTHVVLNAMASHGLLI